MIRGPMAISPYYRALRERIGHELLLIPGVAAVLRDDQGRVLISGTIMADGVSQRALSSPARHRR